MGTRSPIFDLHRQAAGLLCLALSLSGCRLSLSTDSRGQKATDVSGQQSTAAAVLLSATAASLPYSPTPAAVIVSATFPPPATPSPSPTLTASPSFTCTPTATFSPLSCLPAHARREYALVKRVQDGETIIVDIQGSLYSVRYLGIRVPAYLPVVEEYGPEAVRLNTNLVADQIVQLEPDGADKNAFGQLLRYVSVLGSDVFVNYELVRRGYARLSSDAAALACGEMLTQAETAARQEQLGLWAPTVTPRPTRTPTPTRTSTRTATPRPTANLTATAIFLLTHTATVTPSATATLTATLTATPTISQTITVSPTSSTTLQP